MKVSIIVPTHQLAQEDLDRLLSCFDNQKMAPEDFEVIFVDDGSPDDTADRLLEASRTRPNLRALRMQNTGWPSKPRNLGMDSASGKYVLFLDPKDQLYPDSLHAAYNLAISHGADVVVGKETHPGHPEWDLDMFVDDIGQALGRSERHPLEPLTPHKLYRLAFLREHCIRFPEGRQVLWESVSFNLLVARSASLISVLSTVPFYGASGMSDGDPVRFNPWSVGYWVSLRRILSEASELLADSELEPARGQFLTHLYRQYVLGVFDASFLQRREEARDYLFQQAARLQQDFDLTRFEAELPVPLRSRSVLLRRGDRALMDRLIASAGPVTAVVAASEVRWVNGSLEVSVDVAWISEDGHLTHQGDHVVQHLSEDLEDLLPTSVRDLSRDLASAKLTVSLHDRATGATWPVPTSLTCPEGAPPTLAGHLTAAVDLATVAGGAPLPHGHWEVTVESLVGGHLGASGLASRSSASVSLVDGRLHLAYPDQDGTVTVVPNAAAESLRRLTPVGVRRVESGEVELTLAGQHAGEGRVGTSIGLDTAVRGPVHTAETPATLSVMDGRAAVRFPAPEDSFRVQVGDRSQGEVCPVTVDNAELRLAPPMFSPAPVPPSLMHRGPGGTARVLLLSGGESDNVAAQLAQACSVSLLTATMTDLGIEDFTIASRSPAIIPKGYLTSRKDSLLAAAHKAVTGADLIVFSGALAIDPRDPVACGRIVRLLELADEHHVPVLFSGVSLGTFHAGDKTSEALRRALRLPVVRQLSTTGSLAMSAQYLEGTGTPTAEVPDTTMFVDAVFRDRVNAVRGSAKAKRIGLIVTRSGLFKENGIDFGHRDQRRLWLEIIKELKARGLDYRLFTIGHFADEVLLEELVKSAAVSKAKAAITVNSPEELVDEMAACDGIVAYRLEASIGAYALGIPSIGLSWSDEVPAFYSSVGLGHRALGPTTWDAPSVVDALERALEEGVTREEPFLMSTYECLHAGIRAVAAPLSDPRRFTLGELQRALPQYPGTTSEQYRERLQTKLKRAYAAYRKVAY